jgi:trans-aconitate 2-methyltransferase
MSTWDEQQYLRFSNERTRPAIELLGRVPLGDASYVVDLGCGPGNSTQLLRKRWPRARIVGVDSSREMLIRARDDAPEGEWVLADATDFRADGMLDVLFSNALLHWLPQHSDLLLRLLTQVRPGGVLALQMPRNFDEPSHRLMRELEGPWRVRFVDVPRSSPVQSPAFYYDVLSPHCAHVDVWQTRYEHVMPDAASIVEWVKGTGIRPFLARLTAEQSTDYLAAYTAKIDSVYPARADGRRLFSFPRLFIVAQRS